MLDMSSGGDGGISKKAERIEMKNRRIVEGYLYETATPELTDDISNLLLDLRAIGMTVDLNRYLSNPSPKNGRIFSRSPML